MVTALVPILTCRENSIDFIEKLRSYEKIVLLFVIDDRVQDTPLGFAGSRIKASEFVVESIKEKLPISIDYVEWGEWCEKVKNSMILHNADIAILSDCEFARKIADYLTKSGLKFEILPN